MTYSEKLRDPRWQKKRLEIMNRDEFGCQICGDKESTLNVHHKEYVRGKAPWDYDGNHLITLCELCHSRVEEAKGHIAFIVCEPAMLAAVNSFIELCYEQKVSPRDLCSLAVAFPDAFNGFIKAINDAHRAGWQLAKDNSERTPEVTPQVA